MDNIASKIYLGLESIYFPIDTDIQHNILLQVSNMICDLNILSLFGMDEKETYKYRVSLGVIGKPIDSYSKHSRKIDIVKQLKSNKQQHKYIMNLLIPYYIDNYRFNKINIYDFIEYTKEQNSVDYLKDFDFIYRKANINSLEDLICNTKEQLWEKLNIKVEVSDICIVYVYNELCKRVHSLGLKFIDELDDNDELKEYLILEHQKKQIEILNNELNTRIKKYKYTEEYLRKLLDTKYDYYDRVELLSKIFDSIPCFYMDKDLKQLIMNDLLLVYACKLELDSLYSSRCLLAYDCDDKKNNIAKNHRDKIKIISKKYR